MDANEYEISDGYIGSLGVTYKTATAETLQTAIAAAVVRNERSEAEIVAALKREGLPASWADNFTYVSKQGDER